MRDEGSITQQTEDTADSSGPRCLVLRGVLPEDPTFVRLDGQRWILGRGEGCDLRIDYARVSRRHAEIRRQGPLLTIRDLGSTNGTHVNGNGVEHDAIAIGAFVRLGDWLGAVEEIDAHDADCPFSELAPGLWGGSLVRRALLPLKSSASSTVPVLLLGRTGSGKERFARALHHFGGPHRPFHAINCAALPSTLAEAELFGYRKGAFTGADRSYQGQLRAANGGTLFLDEVADLTLPLQAKLLRALDTGQIAPLGETAETCFDARVIAACQTPLAKLVEEGRFREDLAARLSGLVVSLPALNERRTEIARLFDVFLREHSGGNPPPVSTRLYERLCLHDWPGNVRELELLARRLLAVHGLEPLLTRSHLPERLTAPPTTTAATLTVEPPPTRSTDSTRDAAEDRNSRDLQSLAQALKSSGGNVKTAASVAGISRQRAYRLIGSRRLGELVSASRERSRDGENGRGH